MSVPPALVAWFIEVAAIVATVAFAVALRRRRGWALAVALAGALIVGSLGRELAQGETTDVVLAASRFLPFWLKPGYLAVEALLPLAAVAAIPLAIVAFFKGKRMLPALFGATAILALGAIQLGAYEAGTLGQPTILAFEHPHPPFQGLPSDTWSALAQLSDAIPKTSYDATALAPAFGTSVERSYDFVRDQIALDVYPGSMRGANGTLIARAGNPDDQATLLAALLTAQGFTVRFVRANLDAPALTALERRAATMVPAPMPTIDPGPLRAAAGITQEQIDAYVNKTKPHVKADALARVQDAWAKALRMQSFLASRGVTLGASAQALEQDAGNSLRTHYWLQVQQGQAWLDLDPSSGLAMGKTWVPADPAFSADGLPDDETASIRIRIFTDTLGGTAPTTRTVLDSSASVASVALQPLFITIEPSDAGIAPPDVTASTEFMPTLEVAGSPSPGTAFSVGAGASQLARVRLEIDVAQPHRAPSTYGRMLYDRGSNAARAARGVPVSIGVMVVSGAMRGVFPALGLVQGLAALQPLYTGDDVSGGRPLNALQFFSDDAALRTGLALGAKEPLRFTYDRPAIAMQVERPGTSDWGPEPRSSFDIVENGMSAVAADPKAAVVANLARGLLDEDIEGRIGGTGATTAASRLGAVTTDRNDLVVLTSAASANLAPAGAPPQSAQAIQNTLARGDVVIALRSGNRDRNAAYAWWQIDPQTGYAVGRMNDGSGQDTTEYNEGLEIPVRAMKIWKAGKVLMGMGKCENSGTSPARCFTQAACGASIESFSSVVIGGVWDDALGEIGGFAVDAGSEVLSSTALDFASHEKFCESLFSGE